MTIELEKPVRVGDFTIAAIAERSAHTSCIGESLSAYGQKQPVAVLIRHKRVTRAVATDGSSIGLEHFDQRFPGRRKTFEQLADDTDRSEIRKA